MAAVQLSFALRTSANCKTVHLLGSWDNYTGQLPLSKDSAKAGSWKGTFRFQGTVLKQGQRYWYYYIIDGYHVSHDPAKQSTTEPTTGRKLNILDVPAARTGGAAAAAPPSSTRTKRHSRRVSDDIPKGRALSPSKIVSPKPVKPNQTRHLTTTDYEKPTTVEQLASRFGAAAIDSSDGDDDSDEDSDDDSDEDSDDDSTFEDDSDSDTASDVPSLSSSRSTTSRTSSISSTSSCCVCERYGITRAGDRVKLDCGGARCGSSDGESCSSDSEGECQNFAARRQGLVIRS